VSLASHLRYLRALALASAAFDGKKGVTCEPEEKQARANWRMPYN
jgi:hypothetical protein